MIEDLNSKVSFQWTCSLVVATFPDRDPARGKPHRDRGRLPHDGNLKVATTSSYHENP